MHYSSEPNYTDILGVRVSALNLKTAVDQIERWIEQRIRSYVCITGVHGLIESQKDPALRRIHNHAGMVTPDGMPLVYISRLASRSGVSRVYGPDLMLAVCERSQTAGGFRHFLYGSTPETLQRLAERLRSRFEGLNIVGSFSPPFRPLTNQENASIVQTINAANPDIVWVGLSTPKQERWMAENRNRLNAPVLIGVGAAFDFHAGNVRQAPAWMQRACLEWLFRMCMEPRRLWRRYCLNNPLFLVLLAAQFAGIKRWSTEDAAN